MNSAADLFRHGWEIHPSVVLGCVLLLVWYLFPSPRPNGRRTFFFSLGVLTLCLALISPIDPLGDQYLFSAHMLQHLLLILIVPPLLILGLPESRVRQWVRNPRVAIAERILGTPLVAWLSNMLAMVLWHIPTLYNAANASTSIHILEHLVFLVTSCMFWWPVLSPIPAHRLSPGRSMIYLFGAAAISTVLGIIVTFLPLGLYHPYLHPEDELGALHLIRDIWGISAGEDQKLAGLLMWVPGCTVYFIAMLAELGRWYRIPDPDKQLLLARARQNDQEVHHA